MTSAKSIVNALLQQVSEQDLINELKRRNIDNTTIIKMPKETEKSTEEYYRQELINKKLYKNQ